MPRTPGKPSLEEQLARLDVLSDTDDIAIRVDALREALHGKSNFVVARAARLAGQWECAALVPDLVTAFERFLKDPVKTDKGCAAKLACVEALDALDSGCDAVFLKGVRHVQMEPAWGPPEDTADILRSKSIFALVHSAYPDALPVAVDLLVDPSATVRQAAVRAIGGVGGEAAEMLLRMKIVTGDSEAQVTGECFAVLMEIAPEHSLDFVARYLDAEDEWLGNQAALTLGESKHPGVFEILTACWDRRGTLEERRELLLPFALLRCDAAFGFLAQVVRDSHADLACAALECIRYCVGNDEQREAVKQIVEERDEKPVRFAYERNLERR
jgi:HEAT repeat protein